MKYEVKVQLKPDILNVEAKQILASIHSLGFTDVTSLNTIKTFVLEISESQSSHEEIIKAISSKLLTNEIIEDYTFSIIK